MKRFNLQQEEMEWSKRFACSDDLVYLPTRLHYDDEVEHSKLQGYHANYIIMDMPYDQVVLDAKDMRPHLEEWKDIPKWEGYYQVSSYGRIRSIDRQIWNGKGLFLKKGMLLKQSYDKRGYPRVCFRRDDKPKVVTVHRCVALAFIPNPENKKTINHISGIKIDNSIYNLEWNTYKENAQHAARMGLMKGSPSWKGKFGSSHNTSKEVIQLSLDEKVEIARYGSLREAERKTGIASQLISKVCLGHRNKTGGFKWRHAND